MSIMAWLDLSEPETETGAWLREEALNFDKMLSGEPRLDFAEWKRRREERARIVRGGDA